MTTRTLTAVIALVLAAGLAGCDKDEPDATYTTRGIVKAIGGGGDRQLRVHHEAIESFVGHDGEVVGMEAMTMPFPVADGVDLAGIENGDPVEITFEVRWDTAKVSRITAIEGLPEGTELELD